MTQETWRDIPGAVGQYQVSDWGRVRSLDRLVISTTRVYRVKGKLLRPGPMKTGHVSVAIRRGNSRQVHQLVMLAFVGPAPLLHEVLHLNHIPNDNRLLNLKYGTRSENITMDHAAGTRSASRAFIESANGQRKQQ